MVLDDGDGVAAGRLERGLAHLRDGRVGRDAQHPGTGKPPSHFSANAIAKTVDDDHLE